MKRFESTQRSLSVIVPVFNEEENLRPLVEGIVSNVDSSQVALEIVLVDDGSIDSSVAIARELGQKDSRVRLVQHDRNRGLGAAIKTGLESAEGDYVLYTDADLPFEFDQIPLLLEMATPKHIVIGCRNNRGEGGRRWLLSKGYNLICRIFFGLKVRDVNFACKLLPRRAARAIKLNSEGSFIDAELLMECRRLGFAIKELPMTYYPRTRGESTLSRPDVIFKIFKEMTAYYFSRPAANYEIAEETNRQA